MTLPLVRHCHTALNTLHSLSYFAPETEREFTALGLKPGRMCYFAGRSAAMGAVGAGPVAATFYNFSPSLVARHLPRAWESATPAQVLQARLRAADAALRRLLGADIAEDKEVAEAARLALTAAEACAPAGRPLYAAHADLAVPEPPHLALWHAATLLREHRGDGHSMALATLGLGGLDALVTHTATGAGMTVDFALASRGWSREEWDGAHAGLRERGLLDPERDVLTPAGEELRREAEDLTDRLAAAPYEHLGEPASERLAEIGRRLSRTAVAGGAFPEGVFAARK